MAQRGRKPKPTAIKELEGNPGKRPLNDAEPKPVRKAPPCPKWLEPEAKKEWRRLSKQLEQIGVLTKVNQASVFMTTGFELLKAYEWTDALCQMQCSFH